MFSFNDVSSCRSESDDSVDGAEGVAGIDGVSSAGVCDRDDVVDGAEGVAGVGRVSNPGVCDRDGVGGAQGISGVAGVFSVGVCDGDDGGVDGAASRSKSSATETTSLWVTWSFTSSILSKSVSSSSLGMKIRSVLSLGSIVFFALAAVEGPCAFLRSEVPK